MILALLCRTVEISTMIALSTISKEFQNIFLHSSFIKLCKVYLTTIMFRIGILSVYSTIAFLTHMARKAIKYVQRDNYA